jgi:hypothetical protein
MQTAEETGRASSDDEEHVNERGSGLVARPPIRPLAFHPIPHIPAGAPTKVLRSSNRYQRRDPVVRPCARPRSRVRAAGRRHYPAEGRPAYIDTRLRTFSAKTVNCELNLLHDVLKSAVADELIPSNPVAGVERPKVKRNRGTDEPRGYRRLTDRADGDCRASVDADN